MEKCPRCNRVAFEIAPAEPDVGIFVVLLACKIHGQFFIDDRTDKVFWLDDAPK